MGKRIDLTEMVFGKLTVIEYDSTKGKKLYWKCICECGNEKIINGDNLRRGLTQSCGCLHKVSGGFTTHPFYNTYKHQYDRCNNENNIHYENYGGRGIKCLWTLEEACKWYDNNAKPDDDNEYFCDRIDNNGHYNTNNVKWSTRVENNMNKRTTVDISIYETMPIIPRDFKRACDSRGIDYNDFEKIRSDEKSGKSYKYFFKLKR